MATTKNATYKIYNGTDWDTIYFKTSAGQVGESSSLVFLRPGTHKVNGKTFMNGSTHQGITLYATDIKMSSDSDASTISASVNDLYVWRDSISGQLDSMSQDYENRISELEEAITGGEGTGLLETAKKYTDDEITEFANTTLTDRLAGYATTSALNTAKSGAISEANSYTDGKITAILNNAPEAYNTLGEIATWIQNDKTGAAAMSNTLATHTTQISTLTSDYNDVVEALEGKADSTDLNPYIKGLSISGKTITYTKGDGTTGTLTTQDTTYTFNGAVSTIKDNNLTASKALVSNASGKVAVSSVTSTELGYLSGVTSAIQTQLNGKQAANANIRRIFEGSTTPTGMVSGDIWLSY